jgi:hypothetical protein
MDYMGEGKAKSITQMGKLCGMERGYDLVDLKAT